MADGKAWKNSLGVYQDEGDRAADRADQIAKRAEKLTVDEASVRLGDESFWV